MFHTLQRIKNTKYTTMNQNSKEISILSNYKGLKISNDLKSLFIYTKQNK